VRSGSEGGATRHANRNIRSYASVGQVGGFLSPLRLYNTAKREKEPFEPISPPRVTFYSCGPTVYDYAHIGNFRAFLTYDLLKRWLLYLGYDVDHICNLTDVDDKIIERMQRDGVTRKDLTDKYSDLFFKDLSSLNILPAKQYPKATEHIDEIVTMIQTLIEKGNAYRVGDSVYFKTRSFESYGELSGKVLETIQEGQGEGGNKFSGEKEDSKDFVLWKAYKEEDGEVVWDTPIGRGRPGWHIECSAMAQKYLGDTLDIHAGGVDLVFPHHENEIAQTEAVTGKPFCNCWIHNGFVNIDNEKMSKSLGNFKTINQCFKTKLDVRAFRWLVMSSQYRSPLNFDAQQLSNAKKSIVRIDKLKADCENIIESEESSPPMDIEKVISNGLDAFEAGMNDDLNTPRAIAGVFQIVKAAEQGIKKGKLDKESAQNIIACLDKVDSVLGISYNPEGFIDESKKEEEILELNDLSDSLQNLIAKRQIAKKEKNWAEADAIRDTLQSEGLVLVDKAGGKLEIKRTV